MPSPMKPTSHLPVLEMLRGIAACLIVLYHACLFAQRQSGHNPLGQHFHGLQLGVDFFFVLSGFIILWRHEPDLGRPQAAPAYLLRRWLRIAPLLWFATLTKQALLVCQNKPARASEVLRSLLLIPGPKGEGPLITNAWSLTHELLFYLLVLLGILLGRRVLLGLTLSWLLACLLIDLGSGPPQAWHRPLWDNHNLAFGWGMAAAVWLRHRAPQQRTPALLITSLILLGVAALAFEPAGGMDQGLGVRLAAGIGFGLLVVAAAAIPVSGQGMTRLWLLLGRASYSIYLGHSLLLLPLTHAGLGWAKSLGWQQPWQLNALTLAAAMLAVVACLPIWWLIESPMIQRARRWTSNRHLQ